MPEPCFFNLNLLHWPPFSNSGPLAFPAKQPVPNLIPLFLPPACAFDCRSCLTLKESSRSKGNSSLNPFEKAWVSHLTTSYSNSGFHFDLHSLISILYQVLRRASRLLSHARLGKYEVFLVRHAIRESTRGPRSSVAASPSAWMFPPGYPCTRDVALPKPLRTAATLSVRSERRARLFRPSSGLHPRLLQLAQ